MKKILIFSLFILLENGFAHSEADYQKKINATDIDYMKQGLKCENEITNHLKEGNVNVCLKSISMLKDFSFTDRNKKEYLPGAYFNTAQMYFFGLDNKIKAFEYWYKAAKLGHKSAQKNLDMLCHESPWACRD